MSDHFYAVQYRNMHTAIHEVAIFSLEQQAIDMLEMIKRDEEFHPAFVIEDAFSSYVDLIEINFRNPPHHYNDVKLQYVNDPVTSIPDVY